MIWRSAVLSVYPLLAAVVGVAYGGRGLFVLLFFYLMVGAWFAFVLAWARFAREASRWNLRRLESPPRRGGERGPDSGDGELAARDRPDAAVERGPLPARDVRRRRPALGL